MSARSLILIALAALLAALAAIWVSSLRAPESALASPGPLAPGLSEALEQVNQVRLVAAGDETLATLERGEDGWGLVEKHGYPVDLGKLRSLLSAIASAQRVEGKTTVPARYTQLGVEDVSDADARGVRVDITAPQRTFSVIIGDNPVRGSGTYVRIADQAQSWLVDKSIAVERMPANWLVKQIIDVGANRVQAVSITPIEGPAFGLIRSDADAGSDFALQGVPRGREVAANYERDALAGLLSGLTFEDVFAASEQTAPERTRVALFSLDDGRRVRVESWQHDARTYARFDLSLDDEIATAWLARPVVQATADADETETQTHAIKDVATASPTREQLDAQVAQFPRTHQGWVFQLPAFKASNLNKDLEDYLKPKG